MPGSLRHSVRLAPSTVQAAALMVAAFTFALALTRLYLSGITPLSITMVAAAVAFAAAGAMATSWLRLSRVLVPFVGLVSCFLMAAFDGGMYSEALFWMPFVPLATVLFLGMPAAILASIGCGAAIFSLVFLHLSGRAPGMSATDLALRSIALFGAVSFAGLLGWIYEAGRARSMTSLTSAHAQLQAIVDNLSIGVAITDDDGRFLVANQPLFDIFGLPHSPHELGRRDTWQDLATSNRGPRDPAGFRKRMRELIRAGAPVGGDQVETVDGRMYEQDFVPIHLGDVHHGNMWSYRDVTEQTKRAARVMSELHTDGLTGLVSRRRFEQVLARWCDATTDENDGFSLLFIDLDGFKHVNDTAGHAAGDALLKAIADRLRRTVRGGDVVARLGGDEFAVLLRGAGTRRSAEHVAQNLVEAIARPVTVEGVEHVVSGSIGAVTAHPAHTPDELLARADAAMYLAKERGKNRCAFAPGEPDARAN